MDNTELRKELVMMIHSVPEENLAEMKRLVADYIEGISPEDEDMAPLERAHVKPAVLKEIEEAKEDFRQGRCLSHEQAKQEIFGDE